jgi:hypothetical protein
MKAKAGDWLVVHSHLEHHPVRRAVILGVGADGEPPYTVRWTDTDHEGLVFPGPDASIVTAEEEAEQARAEARRISEVQADIRAHEHVAR